jgi:hypothetical protein
LKEECRLRVFKNRVLRRIFGPRRDKVTGEWRKLHNEELNDLYFSPSIVWVIILRIIRWVGHAVRIGKNRCIHGFGGETRGKETTWENPGTDGRKSTWIFRKWDVGYGLD